MSASWDLLEAALQAEPTPAPEPPPPPGEQTVSTEAYERAIRDALAVPPGQGTHPFPVPKSSATIPREMVDAVRRVMGEAAGTADGGQKTDAEVNDAISKLIKRTDNPLYGELGTLPRKDGGVSSEISIGVDDPRLNGGRPTNIPTLVRGQQGVRELLTTPMDRIHFTPQQQEIAIRRALERQRAGGSLPSYANFDQADRAAVSRSAGKGAGTVAIQQDPLNQMDPSVIHAVYGTGQTPSGLSPNTTQGQVAPATPPAPMQAPSLGDADLAPSPPQDNSVQAALKRRFG